MKLPALTMALVFSASAAFAQTACPTQADLGQGIALIRAEPFYSNVMNATDRGLSEARVMARGGVAETVSSTYSHALTVIERVGANGTLALVYEDDVSALNDLLQIGSWTTNVTLLADGTLQGAGTFTVRFMDTVAFTLGECGYETWHVRTSLALEGRTPFLQDRYFAPALGLSLGTVTLDANGNPISGVIYDRIEVQ